MNPVETFQENRRKPIYWPIWVLFGAKKWTHKGHFSWTPESTHNMPLNQVSWCHVNKFWRKWPKTSKIHNIYLFLWLNIHSKLKAKNQNSNSTIFLAIFFAHIHVKYRKDRMKTEGAYSIWKKIDSGQTDRQTDGSAVDNICWLGQQRS